MSVAHLPISPSTWALRRNGFAAFLIAMTLLAGSCCAFAQSVTPTPAASAANQDLVKAKSLEQTAQSAWSKLTPAQKLALAPLASAWSSISEGQKRKWIALSQNYPRLSDSERATLHGRMTEWASLSAAQRNQARLSFAQTKQLSTEEKQTQWQAYQALSEEQKKQLASAGSRPKPVGAAPAVAPVGPNKLAAVPVTRSEPPRPAVAASRPHNPTSAPVSSAAPRSVVQP